MATFPTVKDLRTLPDPFLSYRWSLIIPNVPVAADGKRLQYQCKSGAIPGVSVEDALITSHGIDLQYAGRQMYGQTWNAAFFETRDMYIYSVFRSWNDFQRNHRNATGNYKENYATTALLYLYDDTLKVIKTIILDGFFPSELSEASLDGSSSAPVEFNVTFKFDVSTLQ